jgi:CubicO group peptidase (beta-lactamase class C family)
MVDRRRMISSLAAGVAWSLSDRDPAAAQRPSRGNGNAHPMRPYREILEKVLAEHRIVGGTLAIAREGKLALAEGFGLADADARRPVTPETLFCIGSVTKSITAAATLKLVDQGRVRLDARLVDVVPDIRPEGGRFADPRFEQITVRHVLYHASGIPNRVRARSGPKAEPVDPGEDGGEDEESSREAALQLREAMGGPLDFAPGSTHRYSNSGYLIARLVVERGSGQDYVRFVEQHVFRPMGITRAVMERLEPTAGETGRYVIGPRGRMPAPRKASNWLFTPTEMVLFLTAMAGSRGRPFLSRPSYRAMVAPPPPPIETKPGRPHVGLGWDAVVNTPRGAGFSKDGGKPGVSAWVQHRPDGVSWAFMINTTRANKVEGPNPAAEIRRLVNDALDHQATWPAHDLFRT